MKIMAYKTSCGTKLQLKEKTSEENQDITKQMRVQYLTLTLPDSLQ
jgi:hypothetical protein